MGSDDFDFWIGTWVVTWTGEGGELQSGVNSVRRVDDSIRELFTDGDPTGAYIGASISRWDAEATCWVQDYWDNRGYAAVFRGRRIDDAMVLERVDGGDGAPLTRLVWSQITPHALLWNYERAAGGGAWESTWRIEYTRQTADELNGPT